MSGACRLNGRACDAADLMYHVALCWLADLGHRRAPPVADFSLSCPTSLWANEKRDRLLGGRRATLDPFAEYGGEQRAGIKMDGTHSTSTPCGHDATSMSLHREPLNTL